MGILKQMREGASDSLKGIAKLDAHMKRMTDILIQDYRARNLHENPRYQDPKRLNRFEYQAYSQTGEDGLIAEIFARIGVTNKTFVEFGVGNGMENNTLFLLFKEWKGFWIEGHPDYVRQIREMHPSFLEEGRLAVKQAMITAENIESLFDQMGVPAEFDLLSIDIDGNDYWVWKNILKFRPRVVAIEYNALFRSDVKWVMKYNPTHTWKNNSYFGTSLKSLELLGVEKGYRLVGCTFTGFNAFFVREDLVQDCFLEPYTAENHYEPIRYSLVNKPGHPKGFGPFEQV